MKTKFVRSFKKSEKKMWVEKLLVREISVSKLIPRNKNPEPRESGHKKDR
jgi:hypothetical protein